MYHSISGFDRHDDRYRYHPYRRSDRGYLLDEFKKEKAPIFDGEMDVEAWLLGMKKFFKLHDCLENMIARVDTFSLKGKVDIWWEDVNYVRCIHEEYLTWSEFEWIFKKKYLSERYYGDIAKEFYELQMGSMTDGEYTRMFLELLRYEKRFIRNFSHIAYPMTSLQRKCNKFEWIEECATSFEQMK